MSTNVFKFFSNDDAIQVLQKHLKTTNFKLTSLKIEPLSDEPVGFLAEHFILTMNTERNNLEETQTFFCKILPRSEAAHLKYISDIGAFKKEVKFFQKILPLLQTNTKTSWVPKPHLVRSGLIVMEDLSKNGFAICNNYSKILFDYDHSLVAAQTLAKFHTATLIYEEKLNLRLRNGNNNENNRRRDNMFSEILFENTYSNDPTHPRKQWLDVGIEGLLSLIRIIPEINDHSKMMKISKELPKLLRQMPELIKPSKQYRNAVSHGDLWCNNLMFQYNEDGKPVECVLIDFQLARYAPLAFDLMSLIFNTTTKNDRLQSLHDILNAYYDTVKIELTKHDLDIDNILPRSEFDSSCRYFECPAILEALLFGQNILLPGNMAKEILDSPDGYFDFVCNVDTKCRIILEAFEKDNFFKERMSEMLIYLVEKFIL